MPTSISATLYHLLPRKIHGSELLPLAALETRHPELYRLHTQKYAGRESAMHEPVSPLGCTWRDVVFLSPVPPDRIFAALARSGRDVVCPTPATIDASLLDPARCTIRLMRHGVAGHYPEAPDEHDYLPFTTASLRAVSRVTVDAVERLETLASGDPWLPWVDVPHILHRGPIAIDLFRRPGGE